MKNEKTKMLKVHSKVQLITNSSTVIFTYSEGAIESVKNLINEILKLQGSMLIADDLFVIGTLLEEEDYYFESKYRPEDITNDEIKEIIKKIQSGEIEEPQWMIDEENREGWDYYPNSTSLFITPKSEEYKELANKLLRFLYSTNHEATRDG